MAYHRYPRTGVRNRNKVPVRPLTSGRLTVPSKSGKQWPILFGIGATPVLMYLALRHGCRSAEAIEALEINTGVWQVRTDRLRYFGLVNFQPRLRGFSINMALRHYLELRAVLVQLAEHYGMRPISDAPRRIPHYVRPRKPIPMPIELFHSPLRARILMLVASLGETYAKELTVAASFQYSVEVAKHLRKLQQEGVLTSRKFNQATIYKVDPAYCAANELTVLLRRMAKSMPDMQAAVHAAYFRRSVIEASGMLRERRLIASLQSDMRAIPGASRLKADKARSKIIPFQRAKGRGHPKQRRSP